MGRIRQLSLMLQSNLRARGKPDYSQLMIASDAAGWVLDEEAKEMIRIATKLGHAGYFTHHPSKGLRQCVHYTSFFSLAEPGIFDSNHRISVDYFHGKPDQDEAFAKVFQALKKNAHRLHRLRLSYSGMLPLALEAGVPAYRIHRIPIGINPSYFRVQTPELKESRRSELGIPQSAVVIGSFQKDGQGWGDGNDPKWVKGPDILLKALSILKQKQKELFVVLTGPARGFVKAGLEKEGIPYKHFNFKEYAEIGNFYEALDAYLIASREEGGPKGVLESMVSGVPLVTSRVGQAIDLVRDGENGLVAEVGQAEALAENLNRVLGDSALRQKLISNGLKAAAAESYEAQVPRWREYFHGYLEAN